MVPEPMRRPCDTCNDRKARCEGCGCEAWKYWIWWEWNRVTKQLLAAIEKEEA